jgi:hypothetical protein
MREPKNLRRARDRGESAPPRGRDTLTRALTDHVSFKRVDPPTNGAPT